MNESRVGGMLLLRQLNSVLLLQSSFQVCGKRMKRQKYKWTLLYRITEGGTKKPM